MISLPFRGKGSLPAGRQGWGWGQLDVFNYIPINKFYTSRSLFSPATQAQIRYFHKQNTEFTPFHFLRPFGNKDVRRLNFQKGLEVWSRKNCSLTSLFQFKRVWSFIQVILLLRWYRFSPNPKETRRTFILMRWAPTQGLTSISQGILSRRGDL